MSKRNINGIVLLNKPKGPSSNAALQKVKYLFNAKKAGHTGSLDPLATGMLPICFGYATKYSQYLLESDKQYHVTAQLGMVTSTGDTEGEVIARHPVDVDQPRLATTLKQFIGPLKQVPSMYSALKHQGKPLYKLARKGVEVDRAARDIMIHQCDLMDFSEDRFSLNVHCSRGTYIRTLVEDIGQALGCGAHVLELHRPSVGEYPASAMVALEELEQANQSDLDQYLMPLDSLLAKWPAVSLNVDQLKTLYYGQKLHWQSDSPGLVRLNFQDKCFGLGEIRLDGSLAATKLIPN